MGRGMAVEQLCMRLKASVMVCWLEPGPSGVQFACVAGAWDMGLLCPDVVMSRFRLPLSVMSCCSGCHPLLQLGPLRFTVSTVTFTVNPWPWVWVGAAAMAGVGIKADPWRLRRRGAPELKEFHPWRAVAEPVLLKRCTVERWRRHSKRKDLTAIAGDIQNNRTSQKEGGEIVTWYIRTTETHVSSTRYASKLHPTWACSSQQTITEAFNRIHSCSTAMPLPINHQPPLPSSQPSGLKTLNSTSHKITRSWLTTTPHLLNQRSFAFTNSIVMVAMTVSLPCWTHWAHGIGFDYDSRTIYCVQRHYQSYSPWWVVYPRTHKKDPKATCAVILVNKALSTTNGRTSCGLLLLGIWLSITSFTFHFYLYIY